MKLRRIADRVWTGSGDISAGDCFSQEHYVTHLHQTAFFVPGILGSHLACQMVQGIAGFSVEVLSFISNMIKNGFKQNLKEILLKFERKKTGLDKLYFSAAASRRSEGESYV